MIIWIDAEKSLNEIPTYKKTLRKMGVKGNILNLIKVSLKEYG